MSLSRGLQSLRPCLYSITRSYASYNNLSHDPVSIANRLRQNVHTASVINLHKIVSFLGEPAAVCHVPQSMQLHAGGSRLGPAVYHPVLPSSGRGGNHLAFTVCAAI